MNLSEGPDTLTEFSAQVTLLQLNGSRLLIHRSIILAIALLLVTISWSCSDPAQEMGPRIDSTSECPDPSTGIIIGGLYGNEKNVNPIFQRTLVLMGGGSEDDEASKLFLEATNGGDIVILRASGSLTSYPNYFMSTLSPQIPPNSALTVLTSSPQQASDPAVSCWLNRAEGVWFAGGNQWNYLGKWPAQFQLFLNSLTKKNISVGGTSAGAVSLGEAAFDAENGTIASQVALADPLGNKVSISYPAFYQSELHNTIIESHFSEREREGRLLVFLAKFKQEQNRSTVLGVGLDEGVAIVISEGQFEIFAPMGKHAWIYELSGTVSLTSGSPLNLADIFRIKLSDQSQGTWPIQVQSMEHEELIVIDGSVNINEDQDTLFDIDTCE